MKYGIGIDTGGTYTDAVIFDFLTGMVIAKGKSLTTKENLSVGIKNSLLLLPMELCKQATILSLSTTLATNACVENKGGRAKLILIGSDRRSLEWMGADKKYGLEYDNILCLENNCSLDGKVINHPDWSAVLKAHSDWFLDAQALSVSATYATQNGAICEKVAKKYICEQYDKPFVMASELSGELNTLERGVTAQLNAKLLPVIEKFTNAVTDAVNELGLNLKTMVVRSDGSLMQSSHALKNPVKTILSGPAASIVGGCELSDCPDSLIIDMGGTTTDISIVSGGNPAMTDNIRIGGFLTQVKGVYIDTFGLGGDSRLMSQGGELLLSPRRVLPLCIAAKSYPQIIDRLDCLLQDYVENNLPQHEFFILTRNPDDIKRYYSNEKDLIKRLQEKEILPVDLADPYGKISARLEDEGIIMRCGLTPTDIMHIKGDFTQHDANASILGARYLMQKLGLDDTPQSIDAFCDLAYDAVCLKLYRNIVRVLLCYSHPLIFKNSVPNDLMSAIDADYRAKKIGKKSFFELSFSTVATLVGIGAPTHIFLKTVAEMLGANYVIPEHAEVANAVGAIIADISSTVSVEVTPVYEDGFMEGFAIHSVDSDPTIFEELDEAVEYAKKIAHSFAVEKARERGALGELTLTDMVNANEAFSKDGGKVDLGTKVTVTATGRIED